MATKQPLKKKEVKKPTLSSFKEKMGLTTTKASNADKPMEWLTMPKAYQDVMKLPGIPLGYVTTIVGHSNTGKSTLINHAVVAAQKQGLIPVIYDTENNFDFTYAIDMGMEAEPVYEDVEVFDDATGESRIERQITRYDGDFIYFNNTLLAERYGNIDYQKGVETAKYRTVAVLEDIAYSINELLDAQDNGDIETGFVFIWDSVGSIQSMKSYASKVGNAMFDAASISTAFTSILNDRIPRTRKTSCPYFNTMILVNKVWLDSMTNPVAPPSIELKGGRSIFYAARLIILMGGQLKSSVKRLTAISKGSTYQYGTQTKIKVLKNQLPAPFTVTYEGDLVCTPIGFVGADKDSLEQYRKDHAGEILKKLNEVADSFGSQHISAEDVKFVDQEDSGE